MMMGGATKEMMWLIEYRRRVSVVYNDEVLYNDVWLCVIPATVSTAPSRQGHG